MRRGSIAAAASAALMAVAALLIPSVSTAAVPETLIQPGARMVSPAGCTLNFVFRDDADARYIGTAGHCVGGVGDRVATPAGAFGTVVFRVLRGNDDFALIRIDPAWDDQVSPQMRYWGGPTGVTTPDTTPIGDQTLHYGYGMVFSQTAATRPRAGVLYNDNDRSYHAEHPAIFGDSGSPVLHAQTGRALGVVANIGGHLLNGPTVQRALVLLAEDGIEVALETASFTFPPL